MSKVEISGVDTGKLPLLTSEQKVILISTYAVPMIVR